MIHEEHIESWEGGDPSGDAARQAVSSLRGYAYQVLAAALAWLDLDAESRIYLEVAEDYAVVAKDAMQAVQVKDTSASGGVTLNSVGVRDAVRSFVKLVETNPERDILFRYLTTSTVATEQATQDRPGGVAGLRYWRQVATGADISPLRKILESEKFDPCVNLFVSSRNDEELRRDLIRKIQWDCGSDNLESLKSEFESRLILKCRDDLNIPTSESLRISDQIIYHVLEKSVKDQESERVLTRASLASLLDSATRISLPRRQVEKMISAVMRQTHGDDAEHGVTAREVEWLINGADIPEILPLANRTEVIEDIELKLRAHGVCFVAGTTGVGKTIASRSAAKKVGSNYFSVDFRGLTAADSCSRIASLLARIGGLGADIIILEDLQYLHDPGLFDQLTRVVAGAYRRDIGLILTSYLKPTARLVARLGIGVDSIVECPYFSQEESAQLVAIYDGDPAIWGMLAHASGAWGHPQLVHAFVAGMRSRNWPSAEFKEIVEQGLSSEDIAEERDHACSNLISQLPGEGRTLLYRLGESIGGFSRASAMRLAALNRPIQNFGEVFSSLVGPWIEAVGKDVFRVSPLVSQSGVKMFSPVERQTIHGELALALSSRYPVDANDIDRILLHAMYGGREDVLGKISAALTLSEQPVINFLAEINSIIAFFDTKKPIYNDNPTVSLMLRIVQFRVRMQQTQPRGVSECVNQLLAEARDLVDPEVITKLQLASYSIVLGVLGIANYLDDWIQLLVEFDQLHVDPSTHELIINWEETLPSNSNATGAMFAIGSANLASVAILERIFDQLDAVGTAQRNKLLSSAEAMLGDFGNFINSPWLAESNGMLDARDCERRYKKMASLACVWQQPILAIQCHIARVIMFDEYLHDSDKALVIIDEVASEFDSDILLARARAKVYFRRGDHVEALNVFDQISEIIGKDNPIERAFALREAGISAANCGDWTRAAQWFREAGEAAALSEDPKLHAMSIGLSADAAVALLKSGGIAECLRRMADVLSVMSSINPQHSLQAAHCHHLVRHTLLWIRSTIDGTPVLIGDEPLAMLPGICSNPEPHSEVTNRPLSAVDYAWYMLAECELSSGIDVGISASLHESLGGNFVPLYEAHLTHKALQIALQTQDSDLFAKYVLKYVVALEEQRFHFEKHGGDFDPALSYRQNVDRLVVTSLSDNHISLLNDAIFSFLASCICTDAFLQFERFVTAFVEVIGVDILERTILGKEGAVDGFDRMLWQSLLSLKSWESMPPSEHCVAAIVTLQHASRSHFGAVLIPMLASWQRKIWSRVIEEQKFHLTNPRLSALALMSTISAPLDDESFLYALALASADACGVALPSQIRDDFGSKICNNSENCEEGGI